MSNFITGIISLTLGVVMLANVLIYSVKSVSYTAACGNATGGGRCEWSPGEIAMWGLVSLVSIAGMIYGVISVFGLA